jgi:hypothetical protein
VNYLFVWHKVGKQAEPIKGKFDPRRNREKESNRSLGYTKKAPDLGGDGGSVYEKKGRYGAVCNVYILIFFGNYVPNLAGWP